MDDGRPLLPKVTRRPPRPARKPLLLFARACANRSQTHSHGPRARRCSPAPPEKLPTWHDVPCTSTRPSAAHVGAFGVFGVWGRVRCSCVTYDELLPGVSRAEKIFARHNPFLSLAGGRRRSKLTNQEGGGDEDDRVLAVSFWLRRARRRTGATAVRFRGAGKSFFAPRPPSSALSCTRRACIALSFL